MFTFTQKRKATVLYVEYMTTPVGKLADDMRRAGVPILEGACIRWDAAERCLVVWTLDGREVRFK